MANNIKELGIINEEIQNKIYNVVKNHISNLEQSQLYSPAIEKKYIDLEKRSSKYKAIIDKSLFTLVDELIYKLNEMDNHCKYKLIKNDVTYIKYTKGDFFKPHEDYLSVTSNFLEEYTLLICMDANCTGGETIFHINKFHKHISKESITPNHCLLFRKDLCHEGNVLLDGYKEIITLNLFGIVNDCDTIILVSFPEDNRKYCISSENIFNMGNSYLATLIQTLMSECKSHIYEYKVTEFTYEQFAVIKKISDKSYITIDELNEYSLIIDYYCIPYSNLLIDTSSNIKNIKKNIKETTDFLKSFNDIIIICENNNDQKYLLNYIKQHKLPYVPFTIIFSEGTYTFTNDEDDDGSETQSWNVKMSPNWITMSEYNNILFYRSLVNMHDFDVLNEHLYKSIISLNNKTNKIKTTTDFIFDHKYNYNDDDCGDNEENNNEDDSISENEKYNYVFDEDDDNTADIINFGLKLYTPNITKQQIFDIINECFGSHNENTKYFKPCIKLNDSVYKYYTIDKNGKMFLNYDQLKYTLNRLNDIDFVNIIKNKLNNIKFVFPQHKSTIDHDFCNESVYSNVNLLYVTGFVRMNDN
jgi:hypothetical protein